MFLTASRDKSVALWKLETEKNSLDNDAETNVQPELLHFHVLSSGLMAVDVVKICHSEFSNPEKDFHLVAVGLENGSISLLKISQFKFSPMQILDCSSAHVLDVNTLRFSYPQFQPTKDNKFANGLLWLASCSNDGIVKLFKIVFGGS